MTIGLERLNRTKDEMLGMVAHDLRNPLASIGGYAKLLQGGVAGPISDMQHDLLASITRSTAFMLKMVEDLLDFTAVESGIVNLDRSRIGLRGLLDEEVRFAQLAGSAKRISVSLDAPRDVEVSADERKLHQVVANLLSNAVKFSWEGSAVEIGLRREGAHALISVRDRGQGIPAEEQEHLFRPFGLTSVKGTHGEKSTGLGLAIVRRIVDAHAGRLWVESEVGKGSTFRFTLPALHEADSPGT